MRLGIDSDSVLADFSSAWADAYLEKYGQDYIAPGYWCPEIGKALVPDGWVSTEYPRIFHDLAPIPGAVEGMKELHHRGHELVVITNKPTWALDAQEYWLRNNDIPFDEVHNVSYKPSVAPCDIYLDDAPQHLEDLISAYPFAQVVCFTEYHNLSIEGFPRVDTWEEFLEFVAKVETWNH